MTGGAVAEGTQTTAAESTGHATPRVIVEVLTSSLAGRRFAYTTEQLRKGVTIGRAPECKLRFDSDRDLKVSGHHALLIENDDGIFVRDEGSSNGLYLNKQRVPAEGFRVYDGCEVSLGQEGAVLTLRVPGEPRPATCQGSEASTVADEPDEEALTGALARSGEKTRRMISSVARRLESRATQRRVGLVTLVIALSAALVAIGALAVWQYVRGA